MIVSTCGFGSTGSSAVSDYLMECDNVQVLDKLEFTLATCVDGLEDLEFHLMKQNSRQGSGIAAIQRFQARMERFFPAWHARTGAAIADLKRATDEFVDAITQVKYVGLSPRIYHGGWKWLHKHVGSSLILRRIVRPLERKKIIKRNLDVYPFGEVRLSVRPPRFYEAARDFVEKILQTLGADSGKMLVLDQAFSGNNPAKSYPFFNDPRAVVVDRDPRDMYIFAKTVLLSVGRFIPTANVEDFITYYRVLREGQPYKTPDERCLVLHFEDMVYDYEATTEKIDRFLGVRNSKRKSVFDPALSVANTNLAAKFPQFAEDVAKIREALPEYLFDFQAHPAVSGSGKMFFGKSPLNRK